MSTNRFLSSTVGIDSLAQEATLTELNNFIQSGAVQVGGISGVTIDNFPATQNVNITAQTGDVDVNCTNLPFGASPTNPSQQNCVAVTLANDHLFNGNLKVNLNSIAGMGQPQVGAGSSVGTACQRVVLSNDYVSTTSSKIINNATNDSGLDESYLATQTTYLSSIDNTTSGISDINAGILSRLPAMIGSQLSDASLSITLASDEADIPVSEQDTNFSAAMLNLASPAGEYINTNVKKIGSFDISTNTNTVDDGTQRVVLSNDYESTTQIQLSLIGTTSTAVNSGSANNGTLRTILTDEYFSTCSIQHPSGLFSKKKLKLYFSSSVTGGSNSFNLAYDLTTAVPAAPINTSCTFTGFGVNWVTQAQVYLQISTGSFHNTGWGTLVGTLGTGFGIYYTETSGGPEIPIVNDGSATNQLPSQRIVANVGFFREFCDEIEEFNYGSGTPSLKLTRYFNPPLRITTGGVFFRFGAKENIATNNLSTFLVTLTYHA